jgi:microcystin-dependent protein
MWSGAVNVLPVGWALCDGQSGRPDLRGRFVVGYNPYDTDYNAINKTGGEKTHILSISEMPSHNHADLEGDDTSHGGNSASIDGTARWLVSALTTDTKNAKIPNSKTGYTGGNQPHENRPPYYTLAYIIKL